MLHTILLRFEYKFSQIKIINRPMFYFFTKIKCRLINNFKKYKTSDVIQNNT